MDTPTITKDIHSPEWWFTVVIMGIIVSLVGVGILKLGGKAIAWIVKYRNESNTKRAKKFRVDTASAVVFPFNLAKCSSMISESRVNANIFLVTALLVSFLTIVVPPKEFGITVIGGFMMFSFSMVYGYRMAYYTSVYQAAITYLENMDTDNAEKRTLYEKVKADIR